MNPTRLNVHHVYNRIYDECAASVQLDCMTGSNIYKLTCDAVMDALNTTVFVAEVNTLDRFRAFGIDLALTMMQADVDAISDEHPLPPPTTKDPAMPAFNPFDAAKPSEPAEAVQEPLFEDLPFPADPLTRLRVLSGFPSAITVQDRDGWHVVASVTDHNPSQGHGGHWADTYFCWLTNRPSTSDLNAICLALDLLESQ